MMKNILTLIIGFPLLVLSFLSCQPDPLLQPEAPLAFHVPKGWPSPVYTFANNAVTKDGFELGRKLFYDPRLSSDNSTSCGSCHQQFAAFANLDHDRSHGVGNQLGIRNSPPIFNMAWYNTFFWDGGVNHIELQPIAPIENPVEMNLSLADCIAKLNTIAEYKALFKKAFGSEEINAQKMLFAMAQFMAMLISDQSKYDKIERGEAGYTYTAQEREGKAIFESKCASCHKPPLFTDLSFRNNGLSPNTFNDSGRAHITRLPEDKYKFKVPSLRNLKYTPPYMHDGRINTIDGVLEHYHSGVIASPTLDPALQSGITLSASQRESLKAFLNTLNDEQFVSDKRFAEVK